MKILIINLILHTHEKGVIPRRHTNHDCMIYNMARGFVENGHEVTIAASEEYRALQADEEPFEVVYFPSRLPRVFKPAVLPFPKGLRSLLRSRNYDLIISSEVFSVGSLMASLASKTPLVIWHELGDHQRFMKQLPSIIWYNFVARLLMRRARVVARSEKAREFVARYMPDVAEETVEHGSNSTIFHPGEEADNSFIIVARLVERKQPVKILTSFLEFIKRSGREDYVLHVVGEGPKREEMERMVSEAGAEKNVHFHGFLSHEKFAAIGRRSKGMLVNTLGDLNMVSVSEAILNGTPVLMNTVPLTAGFVNSNRLGIAKADWGADELEEMADRYEEFHSQCVAVGPTLSEKASAAKLVRLMPAAQRSKRE